MLTVLPQKLISPPSRWLLFAMLVSLHLALWIGVDSIWSRPLLLSHFGLFLMWQPLWRGERELSVGGMVFIVCASVVALLWLNLWLMAFWVGGLCALVGGRVFSLHGNRLRFLYLAVMVYLLGVLLMWVVPALFAAQSMGETSRNLMGAVLSLLLAATVLVPIKSSTDESEPAEPSQVVDFFYSLLLFMLLTLLVLGSLAFMLLSKVDYLEALLRMLFIIALMLFALGWLWSPGFGFTGLQPIFSRYLLNVGTPFESWLRKLAESAQYERSPEDFLKRALSDLAELPWLSGVTWQTESDAEKGAEKSSGSFGETSPHMTEMNELGLSLTLYSRRAISPAVLLHIHLLAQLLGYFYQAKRREQHLREVTRLQTVYETGARLTHDLKNMLQSLLALASIAQRNEEEALPVLRWQLPVLMQRIEVALSKLKTPQLEEESAMVPLAAWWENMRQRHLHAALEWEQEGAMDDIKVPAALFDCVADNLIDNALNKRQRHPFMTIRVSLHTLPFSFSVSDAGDAIPAALAQQLMHTVLPSETGLGVGLYQAARWANQLGYRLHLRDNEAGKVCFELVSTQETAPTQEPSAKA